MGPIRREEDFESSFGHLWGIAHRVTTRLLGPGPESEDAAAEALARALFSWRRVSKLPYRDAWVARVATNLSIDVLRRGARTVPAAVQAASTPEDAAVARVVVSAALSSLPRRQREVLALRHLCGLTEPEVAAALGISQNSVKKHASRGMAAVRVSAGPMEEDSVAI